MSPRAEAQAGLVPHELLGAFYHRADLGAVPNLRERIDGRPDALNRISNSLPDFPADLRHGVSQFGVPVIAHGRILSLAQTQSQGMFAPVRHPRPSRSRGNFLGWQYTISQGARVVAALSRQGIDMADGRDDLFLLCLVLAIE